METSRIKNISTLIAEAESGEHRNNHSYLHSSHDKGRFTDFTLIGEGGRKKIYKCFDQKTQRDVALARLKNDNANHNALVYEALLISSLNHPNIVNIYDIGVDENEAPYFLMEYLNGGTLKDFLASPRTKSEIVSTFRDICDAISYAHDHSIIHLDIKPDNILFNSREAPIVCDWGISINSCDNLEQLLDDKSSQLRLLTREITLHGQIKGTPGFASPEQLSLNKAKSEKSDVYSLGALLYYMLYGEKAAPSLTIKNFDSTSRHGQKSFHIDRYLKMIMEKSLNEASTNRYQNAHELLQDINAYLVGASISQDSKFSPYWWFKFIARKRTAFLLLTICLSFLAVWAALNKRNQFLNQEAKLLEEQLSTLAFEQALYTKHSPLNTTQHQELLHKMLSTSIYETPPEDLKTHIESLDALFKKARKDYPDDPVITSCYHFYLCSILSLDRIQVLPHMSTQMDDHFIHITKALPSLSYDKTRRPSSEELLSILDTIANIPSLNPYLRDRIYLFMFNILRCDACLSPIDKDYNEHVLKLIEITNSIDKQNFYTYNKKEKTLTLSPTFYIGYRRVRFAKDSFLSYLRLRKLAVTGDSPFLASYLHGALIETLDVSQLTRLNRHLPDAVQGLRTPHSVQIIGLQHVIVRDSKQEEFLKLLLHNSENITFTISHPL